MKKEQFFSSVLFGLLLGAYIGLTILAFFIFPKDPNSAVPIGTLSFQTLFQKIPISYLFVLITVALSFAFVGALVGYLLALWRFAQQQTIRLHEAQEVNKTKDEFISMVLHHLRTPLSGIKWSLKEILKGIENVDLRESLQQLNEENSRALNAVEHLIEASRASVGRIEYQFEVIPLEELLKIVTESIKITKSLVKEKNLNLQVGLPPASTGSIKIDKSKFIIIVRNLLENAIQYTPNGGLIKINTEERDSAFFFHIADTGIGIPKEDQPRIFLQFFRAKNARSVAPGGFGIGLFLAKVFLEAHNGKIWFTSKDGKGTTFTFQLPIFRAPTEKFLEKIS